MVRFKYITVKTMHKDDNNNNKTCLLIDIDIPDDSKVNTKETGKTKQVKRPGDQGQHDVESEDKNCASNYWRIRNN